LEQAHLNKHIAEDISLKKLSEEFSLHPTYISQLFKQETGMNYHSYLTKLRIDFAKKLLLNSDFNISQISSMIGFSDYRIFSQVFKRLENITPSQFKVHNLDNSSMLA
jgi:two-component system response regulator YesN